MLTTSPLKARLIQLGINIPKNAGKKDLQIQLAPTLRKMAIDHLRHGDGVVARGFRGESGSVGVVVNEFLNLQEQNGEWGTYVEATALAELLGCHLAVTTKTDTFSLYRAEDDDAPIIHLTNFYNTHWAHKNEDTLGDGNCLYNAFALALQDITTDVKDKKAQQESGTSSLSASRGTLFNSNSTTNVEIRIITEQQEQLDIFNSHVSKLDKPSEANKKVRAEEERIAKLSPEERQQIESDHAMALDMARNPSKYNNNY